MKYYLCLLIIAIFKLSDCLILKTKLRDIFHSSKISSVLASTAGVLLSWTIPESAHAIVETRYGALADVGVKEFLVKDSKQHLRLTLPVGNDAVLGPGTAGDPGKSAQEAIELIRLRPEQVGFSSKPVWQAMASEVGNAERILTKQRSSFIEGTKSPEKASDLLDNRIMPNLQKLAAAVKSQDITTTLEIQDETGDLLAELRSMKLPQKKLPFEIPVEYSNLPHLDGRATVEFKIDHKGGFKDENGKVISPDPIFLLEVDGYHAPITAGNFIDLVEKKIYDGSELSAEELTVQTHVPSTTLKKLPRINKIPLELFYKSDKEPTYGATSDDDDRPNETMALPFQAYGALGMSREVDDPDSGISDFFFLKWRQALIAPGRNTIDGYYSCFGYVTQNQDLLKQVSEGDKIATARVIRGIENLVRPDV